MVRVTFSQINDTVLRNINRNHARLADLQEQLSSGRRLNRPSDDPIDMKNDIGYKSEISQGSQFRRNIEDGMAWISMTEVAMTDMNELLQRMRELAVQGASDTLIGREREYIYQEVNQLTKQFMSLANSRYKGDYIFGGTNGDKQVYRYDAGTVHTFAAGTFNTAASNVMQTYTEGRIYQYRRIDPGTLSILVHDNSGAIPDYAPVEDTDYTVDYARGIITPVAAGSLSGLTPTQEVRVTFSHYNKFNRETSGVIVREIEEGVKPQINVTADEIFEDPAGGADVLGSIMTFMDGLKKDRGASISSAIDEMDRIFAKVRAAQSSNGARLNRFELTVDRNSNRQIELTRLLSELEDLDFASAITDFSMSENVYSASLKAGARVILPTLGDYI